MNGEMSYAEWVEKFKPIPRPGTTDHFRYDENDDFEEVKRYSPYQVWTEVDFDEEDGSVILNGYHINNRTGYFVTEVPWEKDDSIYVIMESLQDMP